MHFFFCSPFRTCAAAFLRFGEHVMLVVTSQKRQRKWPYTPCMSFKLALFAVQPCQRGAHLSWYVHLLLAVCTNF